MKERLPNTKRTIHLDGIEYNVQVKLIDKPGANGDIHAEISRLVSLRWKGGAAAIYAPLSNEVLDLEIGFRNDGNVAMVARFKTRRFPAFHGLGLALARGSSTTTAIFTTAPMKFPLNCVCPSPNHIEKTASQKEKLKCFKKYHPTQLLPRWCRPCPKGCDSIFQGSIWPDDRP
jgi:hypothetical protein